jgi:hypothetical protein
MLVKYFIEKYQYPKFRIFNFWVFLEGQIGNSNKVPGNKNPENPNIKVFVWIVDQKS